MADQVSPPNDRRYCDTHEWCLLDGDVASVGITDFAASELTDVTHVEIVMSPGDAIAKGEKFGEVESVKAFSDVYAPMGGIVEAVNEAFEDDENAALVNRSAFQDGWMIKIKVSNADDYAELLDAEGYRKLIMGES